MISKLVLCIIRNMFLLLTFAFLAGFATILSPCILPVLPIILSSAVADQNPDRKRSLGVILGFILSFTFFTLFLSIIVDAIGIQANILRVFSIIIIAGFGLSLLIPGLQRYAEYFFSALTGFVPPVNNKSGFIAGLIVGISLGLLWTPCVGPILASVISLAIVGKVTFLTFGITLAYSLGTSIPMMIIMLGGRGILRKVPWLMANTSKIQSAFGVVMILTAIGLFMNFDRTFQSFIIAKFPQYGAGLTSLENTDSVRKQLENVGNLKFNVLHPKVSLAPEIIPGGMWFNSEPLTLAALKGKVVLIDFWTYSCINCQRTFPYLKKWWESYKDKGLVIIGVHAPEFEFEKDATNVGKAISDFGIKYPVVQDNDFATWRAYNNLYWPAKYFVDKDGYIRYTHFGEGNYDESEKVLQELLNEAGAQDDFNEVNNSEEQSFAQTPETYLGYKRIVRFASPEKIVRDNISDYSIPDSLTKDTFAFGGLWNLMAEYANPEKGAKLELNFSSKELYLVMKTTGNPAVVKVFIDDIPQSFGIDVVNGLVNVTDSRLYKLVRLATPGRHKLRLEFQDGNAQLFAFTFG